LRGSNGSGGNSSKGQGWATRQQQQRQEQRQRGKDSCENNDKGDAARERKAVTTTGYHGNGDGKVGSNGGGESDGQCGDDSGVP
jgi:hypothetical protein